jgi:hypothetical protein
MIETIVSVIILCNNYNWEYSPRCTAPVVEFYQTETGFYGTLESGVEWKQTIITNKIHLFEMEEVRWLTYEDKVVYI